MNAQADHRDVWRFDREKDRLGGALDLVGVPTISAGLRAVVGLDSSTRTGRTRGTRHRVGCCHILIKRMQVGLKRMQEDIKRMQEGLKTMQVGVVIDWVEA